MPLTSVMIFNIIASPISISQSIFQWKHRPLYSEQSPLIGGLFSLITHDGHLLSCLWLKIIALILPVSPVHLFLASPDTRLAVAPEFRLVIPTFESHIHTVLPATVIIQLKSTLLNCKWNQKESFPIYYQLLPMG